MNLILDSFLSLVSMFSFAEKKLTRWKFYRLTPKPTFKKVLKSPNSTGYYMQEKFLLHTTLYTYQYQELRA